MHVAQTERVPHPGATLFGTRVGLSVLKQEGAFPFPDSCTEGLMATVIVEPTNDSA